MTDLDAWPPAVCVPSSDGVDIATYDLSGEGDDLLFVHATGLCAAVWQPLIDQLGARHRCTALDVRGHGRSSIPSSGMDWSGTARDVLAAVDALGLERPFGVGHSMGGASLVLAEQARPGTFRGMWLFEPIIIPPEMARRSGDDALAEGARRRRSRFDTAEAATANFSAKAPLAALDPDALHAYVAHGFDHHPDRSVTLRCRPDVEAATYEMGGRHDAYDHLGELGCPVVVARGSTQPPGPASFAPGVVERLGRAELEEHPELGHFGPLEDPASMAAAVQLAVAAAS